MSTHAAAHSSTPPTVILIPAYEPDHTLVSLVRSLVDGGWRDPIVIVDDGSGSLFDHIFDACEALRCEVIRQRVNRGKGVALKLGFAHIATRYPHHSVACADCDGQHRLSDILRVGSALVPGERRIVLGSRRFDGRVPLRSRLGNRVTRYVFFAATGVWLRDTQTGLRAYPASLLDWLQTIDGERFEFEINALVAACTHGIEIREVPIDTVYLEGNQSSHFQPLRDSVRIYRQLLPHIFRRSRQRGR